MTNAGGEFPLSSGDAMPRVRIRLRKAFMRYRPGDVIMLTPIMAKAMVASGLGAYEKAVDEPPADKMIRGAMNK